MSSIPYPTRRRLLGAAGFGGLASALLPTRHALATAWPVAGTKPFPNDTPISGSFIGPSFKLTPWDGNLISLAFSADAVGTVTLERSTDGGATWAPIKTGSRPISVLTRTGTFSIVDSNSASRYRLNYALSAGSVRFDSGYAWTDPVWSKGQTAFTQAASLGPIVTSTGTVLRAGFPDKPGGFLVRVAGPILGTSPAVTSYTITVMRSTDGGSTWSAIKSGSSPYNFAILPGSTPAIYRVDCTMSPASVTAGGIFVEVIYKSYEEANRQIISLNLDATPTNDDAYSVARWAPLVDTDLSGDFTLYKVCAGNTFAKVTVPAAAQRLRGPFYSTGRWRDIRADFVDVVGLVDANGAAVPQAASQTDASTIYTPGNRTTYRDPTGGQWTGDFMCTAMALGIYGYPTLIEAVQGPTVDRSTGAPVPNLAAISAALN